MNYHRTNFGKLIISRNGDMYTTFHKLNLIIIKGNGNVLNINHEISKLIINGSDNNIEISSSGNVKQIILKGNINKITSKSPQILNISDFGSGNKRIFDRIEDEDDEDDNIEIQPQRYVVDSEHEDTEEDVNEEEDELGNNNNQNNYQSHGDMILEIVRNINVLIERTNMLNNSVMHIFNLNMEINTTNIESILSNLVDISFKNKDNNKDNEKCAICYENFLENEQIKMTGCFHLFHFQCIKKWIETKSESPDCPICRMKL